MCLHYADPEMQVMLQQGSFHHLSQPDWIGFSINETEYPDPLFGQNYLLHLTKRQGYLVNDPPCHKH